MKKSKVDTNRNIPNRNYSVAFYYASLYNQNNKSPRASVLSEETACVPVGAILFRIKA